MKVRKRLIPLFLVLASVVGIGTMASAVGGSFTDVPSSHWAYNAITKWGNDVSGALEETEDGTFAPDQPMTLGEVAAILSRYLGYTERTEVQVTPAWADKYVENAVAAGVIEMADTIDASVVVTREQAIKYFALAFGIDPVDDTTTFADDESIGAAYKPYVNAFQRLGLVNGVGGNIFDPQGAYTRAQAVQLLNSVTTPRIVGVQAIGFVDVDGTKVSAIAVEYNVDLTGAQVDENTYDVTAYAPDSMDNVVNYGGKEIGDVNAVYVNNEPDVSDVGGTGTGNYVIIEIYTDYVLASEPRYSQALAVGVTQKAEIRADNVTVAPGGQEIGNYKTSVSERMGRISTTRTAYTGTFTIKGLEGYKLYTNNPGVYGADGPAYIAYDCFNEKTGQTYDYELQYALYLPEDYDPNGTYAMVVVDQVVSPTSQTHPFEALLVNYNPTYFISDEAQQIVKDTHGLDGLIVVAVVVNERVDDNACLPAIWMAMVELWDYIQEQYPISKDHVYGTGQSVGGMLLMQTNVSRDNYFAGILCFGNQWGQNYYKDTVFARGMSNESYNETADDTPRHYPNTADSYYIWDYHWGDDGEKVYEQHDPYNFYYLISDDNLMVFNGSTNCLSVDIWNETNYLYSDLAGYSFSWLTGLDAYADIEDQNQAVYDFLAKGNAYGDVEMGIYVCTWEGGSNDATAIWSRRLTAGYEWLLSQTRETEMERPKLDINKPFELADEQIKDESRVVVGFYDKDTGENVYFLTGKAGAGTQFYNTSWLQAGSGVSADANPGWLPDGMSWEVGVEAAAIQSVKAIGSTGNYTAVAVEYDVDMENVLMHLVGDAVVNSKGEAYDDYFVTNPPFDFYDADGNKIDCEIINYYVNSAASAITGAERGSGSGNYVIIEFKTPTTVKPVGAIQRTTVITDTAISSATGKLYT